MEENKKIGSCTCVILEMNEQESQVNTVNLGDSGYLWVRKEGVDGVPKFETKSQQHSFNFPFQIGYGGDDPARGDIAMHQVKDNDIFIVGSDGLWDNLYTV